MARSRSPEGVAAGRRGQSGLSGAFSVWGDSVRLVIALRDRWDDRDAGHGVVVNSTRSALRRAVRCDFCQTQAKGSLLRQFLRSAAKAPLTLGEMLRFAQHDIATRQQNGPVSAPAASALALPQVKPTFFGSRRPWSRQIPSQLPGHVRGLMLQWTEHRRPSGAPGRRGSQARAC
jgi:hypothetical protein